NGGLKKLIDADGLRGVTSNPSIFEKAINSSDEYDDQMRRTLQQGDRPVGDLYERLAVEDIKNAADVLRPVFDATGGADGFVSVEVSPYLAMETDATIAEARRLWGEVDREKRTITTGNRSTPASRARLRSPLPGLPTSATGGCLPASAGNGWRRREPGRSGCSGRAPAPRAKPTATCSMWRS